LTSVSPSFKGLKWAIPIDKRPEKHQQKLTCVSPYFKGLKWAIPIGKRPEKHPPKNEHSVALIAGQQTGGI
jgi:hypothetical protein